MKQLKFRAWDVKEGRYDNNHHIMLDLNGNVTNMQNGETEYILEQFTETHDILGLEVYAGDIVEFTYGKFVGTSEVVFYHGAFCLFSEDNHRRPILYYTTKIVGNIHKGKDK